MRSDSGRHAPLPLKIATLAVILFLHLPALVIVLYAFTTEDNKFTFPPPGLTLRWFGVAFRRSDAWGAFFLSLEVAALSMALAIVLGMLAATAIHRFKFPGREAITFLLVLPLALPGIVTAIALRSAMRVASMDFSFWTIVLGHATFCIVVVYNNVIARYRRMPNSLVEASMDLGASSFQTFWHVVLPGVATALLAGALLAFALSMDEVVVTTFTAGSQETLPVWIYNELTTRPRFRPVTNVVALFVMVSTFIPILLSHWFAQRTSSEQ